jgi:hypothetical protein
MVSQEEPQGQDAGRQSRQPERRRGLFPQDTLEEALRVATAIRDQNAGRPFNRLLLAQAVNRTPASSAFRSLITSSAKYGLTIGNYNSQEVELSDLGRSAVYHRTDDERASALAQAALHPPLFARFFQKYNQNRFPREDLAINTLQVDFGVPGDLAPRCLEVIHATGAFAGILRNISEVLYVMLDAATPPSAAATPLGEAAAPAALGLPAEQRPAEAPPIEPPPSAPPCAPPRVFISHSKSEAILEQLKTILNFGAFAYEIAQEEETPAIPVPTKVRRAMRRCNCAVINISADEQEKLPDGTYGINQNVLIEIGAAFVLYYPRVVLLVDRRIALPSNLQGLYRCDYEGEELSWSAGMKLQNALAGFREPLPADEPE